MRISELAGTLRIPSDRLRRMIELLGVSLDGPDPEVDGTHIQTLRQYVESKGMVPQSETAAGNTLTTGESLNIESVIGESAHEATQLRRGNIKFVDRRTGTWGYIIPEDGSRDIRFEIENCEGLRPSARDAQREVEFILDAGPPPVARRIRLIGDPTPQPVVNFQRPTTDRPAAAHRNASFRRPSGPGKVLGEALTQWAFVPFVPFEHIDRHRYSSVLELLAGRALHERWHTGAGEPDPTQPFPILESYLRYTFYRLQREDNFYGPGSKIFENTVGRDAWAVFNTGLVNNLYDPIYALFVRNERAGRQPWRLYDFCVPGQGYSGKQLTKVFDPLPEPARYFDSTSDMLLDTAREFHLDIPHIVVDGIKRGRYPISFLEEHVPEDFAWQDPTSMPVYERNEYLRKFGEAVEEDDRCYRDIKRRVEDATDLALKRTRWNFKTAIPQYYPRLDEMSFLLPLAIQNDEIVDVALVISKNPSGSYQGSTILPLEWAYKNARLVCRPDSDWLTPERIRKGDASEIGDGED
jgi:hypothetical protein